MLLFTITGMGKYCGIGMCLQSPSTIPDHFLFNSTTDETKQSARKEGKCKKKKKKKKNKEKKKWIKKSYVLKPNVQRKANK